VISLEDRLRRDLQEIAERIDAGSVRQLRVPERRRAPGMVRWLAPVTAMAAVVGVIAGVHLAAAPGQPPALPGTGAEPAGSMPPYYVTVFQAYTGPQQTITTTAVVHDSATGASLATVGVPTLSSDQGVTTPTVTAAAGDRTFVITETDTSVPSGQAADGNVPPAEVRNVARFYLLRVAAGGRSAELSQLPLSLPESLSVDEVALSPDGSMLALALQDCSSGSGACLYNAIRVVGLATGATTDWTTDQPDAAVQDLSWAGDDYLAFGLEGGNGAESYRLLNLTSPGRNLLAASAIPSPAPVAADGNYTPPALITPDGQALITTAVQNIPGANGRYTVVLSIVELSVSTGKQLQVLYSVTRNDVSLDINDPSGAPSLDQSCSVVSLGPSGVQPLVDCLGLGRVENGKFTPLPGFPSPGASGISNQDGAAW
jgi:hypothetical protein